MEDNKKSVSEILIERFLKEVDERGVMPWQKPYENYLPFNYFSKQPYRGFNRILLPFGEYITSNQINTYNKEHNEDFRYQKGIQWYPVYFFKKYDKECSKAEVESAFPDADLSQEGYIGTKDYYAYYHEKGMFIKSKNLLRYYLVADRTWFKNSKDEMLPSRLETGEVILEKSEPKKVFDSYVERSGIQLNTDYAGIPCYMPSLDKVFLNPHTKNESTWYSTAFHEFAHSTGAKKRLNRVGVTYKGISTKKDKDSAYAVEECIAEITAYLCCSECGVYEFETSGTMGYDNNIAYVQSWKKYVKDFGKEFLYICSQADKAFSYIMGEEI